MKAVDGERSLQVLRPGGMLVSVPSGVPEGVIAKAEERRQRVTGILVEAHRQAEAGHAGGKIVLRVA